MPATSVLSDVDPIAITICKQGANRQRIFLRKTAREDDLRVLPARTHQLIRKADGDSWEVFYCVVAEPGAEEDPGMTGSGTDTWASEDEIRKAAHRLLKNGAYVNAMHDALAAEGCSIVENAVALADFDVVSPEGVTTTIRKGSWYVAIEPGDEFRGQVDAGEITGVSLEGTGIRTPVDVAKAKAPAATHRTCKQCGAHLATDATKCKSCGASWVAKTAGPFGRLLDRLFPGASPAPIAKSADTFGTVMAQQEVTDGLWRATDVLHTVIREAYADDGPDDPAAVVEASLDQFKAWVMGRVRGQTREAVAKELGTVENTRESEDDVDEKQVKQLVDEAIEPIKKSTEETNTAVTALADGFKQLLDRVGKEPEPKNEPVTVKKAVDQLGALADAVDGIDGQLQDLAKSVAQLAEGDSQQDRQADTQQIRKTANPLAGLLS
jgi:ribosomal protein L40E